MSKTSEDDALYFSGQASVEKDEDGNIVTIHANLRLEGEPPDDDEAEQESVLEAINNELINPLLNLAGWGLKAFFAFVVVVILMLIFR